MSFVLLQLMNGLKYLQAQGVEEVGGDLERFLLARAETDTNYRSEIQYNHNSWI